MSASLSVINNLVASGCSVEPCGSRVTCNPAPTDTDQDYLVVAPGSGDPVGIAVNILAGAGYRWEGSENYQDAASTFMSWRLDDVNFILTSDANFADKHRLATSLCKRFNLLQKADRIALFQAVLYGAAGDVVGASTSAAAPSGCWLG